MINQNGLVHDETEKITKLQTFLSDYMTTNNIHNMVLYWNDDCVDEIIEKFLYVIYLKNDTVLLMHNIVLHSENLAEDFKNRTN